ncbi:all-trans-retinol 13,14-reductase-like isoform X1 [Zonotrichia leucophrys gambelii]|uniref:all-trans-retinol 13,14-reductase-like isoform X1 n=1 Tax=Zonotrichia leucophrys gambelii TaxID=257770 RepID=UPI00314091E5
MWPMVLLLLPVALATLALARVAHRLLAPSGNPFSGPPLEPPRPLVTDQRARDRVLKQGFSARRVPAPLDAVVIGSGVGGLAVAATLAKAGRRVLVLEQHDQAGGCCHTFQQHGVEFDVGIHYVGQLHEGSLLRVALDQVTDGQLCWHRLPDPYDEVTLGARRYLLRSGKVAFVTALEEQFPEEKEAIREFMRLSKVASRHAALLALLKLSPRWLVTVLLRSGLLPRLSPVFRMAATSHSQAAARLTSNPDLRALFGYLFYGTAPRDSSFLVNALMVHHYQRGAWYPRGGASEVAFHAVPVIERAGGAVLVRAPVTRVLVSADGTALGVAVRAGPGEEELEIRAPLVISDAGIFNTFGKLLPPHVRSQPGNVALLWPWCSCPRCHQHPWCPQHAQTLIVPGIPVSLPEQGQVPPSCPCLDRLRCHPCVPAWAQVPPPVPVQPQVPSPCPYPAQVPPPCPCPAQVSPRCPRRCAIPPGHAAPGHGLLPGVRGAAGQRSRAAPAPHQLLDLPPQRPGCHDDPVRCSEPRRGPREPGHDVHHLPRRQGPHVRAAAPRQVLHDHPDHGTLRVVRGVGREPPPPPRPRIPALQDGHRPAAAGQGPAPLPAPAGQGGVRGGGDAAEQPALPGGGAGGDVRHGA